MRLEEITMWVCLVLEEEGLEDWSQALQWSVIRGPGDTSQVGQEGPCRMSKRKPVCLSMKNVSCGRGKEWSVVPNATDSSNEEGCILTTGYGNEGHWWHSQGQFQWSDEATNLIGWELGETGWKGSERIKDKQFFQAVLLKRCIKWYNVCRET